MPQTVNLDEVQSRLEESQRLVALIRSLDELQATTPVRKFILNHQSITIETDGDPRTMVSAPLLAHLSRRLTEALAEFTHQKRSELADLVAPIAVKIAS